MKKTILALLATAVAFSASAENVKEGKFYFSSELGGFLQNKVAASKNGDTDSLRYKSKTPNTAFDMGVSVGYYALDNFRVEVAVNKPFLNKSTQQFNRLNAGFKDYATVKLKVAALQLKSYVDLFEISDSARLYAGGGVGLANVQGKRTYTSNNKSYKFKNRYNFAYSVAVGAEFDATDRIKLGLEYNWKDYGKAQEKKPDDATDGWTPYKTNVRGHSILAKLRLDI
ncbi:hypothetical protein phytr_11390 [Candidatus Phycorickettsia trachydisci]|uniref:Outer membrane protein beta-barrel domain-containing protein n=1 Tax=Candidatus Phycorickettsia trachydisci TaxID=2115978 RepID=A0A2P1P9V6_9RICK|nr:acyloxyacyl hydrolase [Candidatus Phycorickettsia trachydisci]AVP88064.1 hypothetical protein phytr_11390 [Candidatus Phycorickettsia trachydisci]